MKPAQALENFLESVHGLIEATGRSNTLEELAAAWNGISDAMTEEEMPEHIRIAREIAGREKPTLQ